MGIPGKKTDDIIILDKTVPNWKELTTNHLPGYSQMKDLLRKAAAVIHSEKTTSDFTLPDHSVKKDISRIT